MIYLDHSPFHAGSVALVLKPETGHVSPQFNVVFDGEFSTVIFMREGTIPQNWIDIVQCSSQSGVTEKTNPKDTWFTAYLKEYPIKTLSHEPIFAPGNNNKTIMPPQSKPHVQESMSSKGESVSEVNKRTDPEGFRNTSNLKKF